MGDKQTDIEMQDLIDSQPTAYDVDKVIDKIRNIPHGAILNVALEEEIIEIVKSGYDAADKHSNGWIPCSERLPEKDGFYLTTVIFEGKSSTCRHLFDTDNSEWLDSDYMPFVNDEISEIIAWKPLPEPYEPKGE